MRSFDRLRTTLRQAQGERSRSKPLMVSLSNHHGELVESRAGTAFISLLGGVEANRPRDGAARGGALGVSAGLVLEAVVLFADDFVELGDDLFGVFAGQRQQRFGAFAA